MAKKVSAPVTHNPGGQRPREHLAYLNDREMAYLMRFNGGNMERGPKGLPSFAFSGPGGPNGPNSAPSGTHDTRSSSTSSKTSSTNNSYGNTGRGAGSNYGAGSGRPGTGSSSPAGTGQGGQRGAGSNYGPGSGRPGTSSSPAGTGSGGQRGAGSNYGPGSARPGSSPSVGSPVGSGGQRGAGSNYGPGSARPDQNAQQQSAIKDAVNAAKNPALGKDLAVGGIKTINVGPMGTPVKVASPAPARMSPQNAPYDYGGALVSGVSSIANSIGAAAMSGINSLFGSETPTTPPTKGDRFSGAYDRVPGSVAGPPTYDSPNPTPTDDLKGPLDRPVITQDTINRMKDQYGQYKNPNAGYSAVEDDLAARGARMNDLANAPDDAFQGYDNYDPLTSVSSNPVSRSPGKTRGLTAEPEQEHILSVENVPEVNPITSYGPFVDRFSYNNPRELADSIRNAGFDSPTMYGAVTKQMTVPRDPSRMGPVDSPDNRGYNMDSPDIQNSFPPDQPSSPSQTARTDVYDNTPYGEPGDIQRPKSRAEKYSHHLPSVFGIGSRIGSYAVDKEWGTLSPEERMSLMDKWNKQNAAYVRNQSPSNDRKQEVRTVADTSVRNNSSDGTKKSGDKETSGSGRPRQYFMWDAGVNIPSPSDSDYTLYLKYLQEKSAFYASEGIT